MSRDTPPLRVAVVDDEPLARDFVRGVLEEVPGVEIVAECVDGVEAVAAVEDADPELVLLDVQMPEVSGFDVIERVGTDAMPEIVFVTAHEEYTLQAFEVHALDYVVKPFDPVRLRAAIAHARERIAAGREDTLGHRLAALLDERAAEGRRFARRITVRDGDRIEFVAVAGVDWIEAAGNYVRLHVGRDAHLIRSSMRGLLKRLDPGTFVRIHRSAAVNLDRVREVHPWFGGDYRVILETGQELRVGRTYRDRLLQLVH